MLLFVCLYSIPYRTIYVLVNLDVAVPDVQQPSRRAMEYQGHVDQKTPQDPRMHIDMGSDDEDYSGESSGTEQ